MKLELNVITDSTQESFPRKSLGLSKNFLPFMEPKGLLPCSQQPATRLYIEPHESSPHPHIIVP
jgi:hypothetical protein